MICYHNYNVYKHKFTTSLDSPTTTTGDIIENTCYYWGTHDFAAELPYLRPEDIDKEFNIETSRGNWNIAISTTEMEPQWNASSLSLVGSGGHLTHDPLSVSREWSQSLRRQQDNNIYTATQTTLQSDISGDVLDYLDVELASACNTRKADLTSTSYAFPTYGDYKNVSHIVTSPEASHINPQCTSQGNHSTYEGSLEDEMMSECSGLATNTVFDSRPRSNSAYTDHPGYTEAVQCLSLDQDQIQIQQSADILSSTPTSLGPQTAFDPTANEPTLMRDKAAISQYYLDTLPLFSEVGRSHSSHISVAQPTAANMVSDVTVTERSPNYSLVSPSDHPVNLYWPPYQSTARTSLPLTHAPFFGGPTYLIDEVHSSNEAGKTISLSHEVWPKNCPSSPCYQSVMKMHHGSRQPQCSKEVGLLHYTELEQPRCSHRVLEDFCSNPHHPIEMPFNPQQMKYHCSSEVVLPHEMKSREYHCSNEAVLPSGHIEMKSKESHCSSEVGLPLNLNETNEAGLLHCLRYAAGEVTMPFCPKQMREGGQAEATNFSPSHFSPGTTDFSPNLSPIASNFSPIASNFSPSASLSHESPLANQLPSPPPKHASRKTSSSRRYSNSSAIDGSPANSEQSSSCSSSTADASEYSKLHRTRSVEGKSRKKKKSTVQQQQWSKTMNPLNLLAFRQLIVNKLKKYSEPEQKKK